MKIRGITIRKIILLRYRYIINEDREILKCDDEKISNASFNELFQNIVLFSYKLN